MGEIRIWIVRGALVRGTLPQILKFHQALSLAFMCFNAICSTASNGTVYMKGIAAFVCGSKHAA